MASFRQLTKIDKPSVRGNVYDYSPIASGNETFKLKLDSFLFSDNADH